ncbi:PEGA domain-containing protein, partial [Methanospirillum hungatei]|uniref:PEGA domain-containing protein n=1 Tax=Methanospirillum hungatei TaxID=2203 RepID=UPI0026EC80DC
MTTIGMRLCIIGCILLMGISVVSAMTGELKIITDPVGATVVHDGSILGETPLVIPDLPMGEYTFKIKKTGYKDVTKTVNIRTLSRTVRYSLVPEESVHTIPPTPVYTPFYDPSPDSEKVSVKIYSVPDGASVFINSINTDQVTPAT